MDRYDAILEHLKEGRNRGLEMAASRLDTVVESLEQLIRTAKSTVEDALPKDIEEVFPLSEVEALIAEVRSEKAPTAGISLDDLRTLDGARSQSELLRALLPILTEHVGRAVVLVIRDGVISAWSGIGFADGEKLRSWHGGVNASPDFQHLVETSKPLRMKPASDPLISEWLEGETIPDEAVLLPISLRGKLMGMIYIDHDDDDPWNVEAAQALNAVACWLIDTLRHRAIVPTPTLAEVTSSASIPMDSEVAEIFAPPPEPEAVEIDYDFEPEPPPVVDEAADAGFDPSATVRVERGEKLGPPEISPKPGGRPPPPPESEATVEPQAPAAEAKSAAPPPMQPVEPPSAAPEPIATDVGSIERSPEEETRHEEARRFARLLVSEIKLYNEDEVERGRVEKDLGERLKDDIERSREMFEKRISAEVRDGQNHFRDELVRILADGDADALGM